MAATLRQRTLRALFGALLPALAAGLLLSPPAAPAAGHGHGGKAAKAKCKRARAKHSRHPSRACAKARRSKPKLQMETEATGTPTTTGEPATASKSAPPGLTNPHKPEPEATTETPHETPPPEPDPTPEPEPEPEPQPEPDPTPEPEPEAEPEPQPEAEPEASEPPAEPAPEAEEPTPPPAPFRFFSPQSIWNAPLPADAPVDPESSALATALREEVSRELEGRTGPAISTTSYSVPVYRVPADQPTVPVRLTTKFSVPALVSAWSAVPLPDAAQAAAGSDGHLVVWQPSSDRLWEFWRLSRSEGAWQAPWGGALQHVSTSSGTYGPEAWPGANGTWGAAASGLSIAGGLITLEELERGEIDHALAISLPQIRSGVYASPATRTDGRSLDPLSLPEGAHLRIDPNLDLSKMRLPRLTRMLAEAAQRYGIVVRDIAGSVTFYGEDPTQTGTNPYFGTSGYFEGNFAGKALATFPWDRLQVLQMDLHTTR